MIGRLDDVNLATDRVIRTCNQQVVTDHPRRRAKHQVISESQHGQVAATLRSAFHKIRRTAASHVHDTGVTSHQLSDYDKNLRLRESDFPEDLS